MSLLPGSLGFQRECQNISVKDLQRLKAVRKSPEKHAKETTYGVPKGDLPLYDLYDWFLVVSS